MIRNNQRFLTQAYILADVLVIFLVFLLSWWIKFGSGWLDAAMSLSFQTYLIWGLVYIGFAVVLGFGLNLYRPKRKKRFSYEGWKVIQVQVVSWFALISLLFVAKEIHISREFLGIFLLGNIGGIISYRFILKLFLKHLREKGYNKQYVLILGAGTLGKKFYDNLSHYPELGYEVFGFLDDYLEEHPFGQNMYKPILGKVDDLEVVLQQHLIDEVIVALPLEAHRKYSDIINTCEKYGVKTLIIPDYFDMLPARPNFDDFAGIPLINVRDVPLEELGNRFIKRSFDLVFSAAAILVMLPLWAVIAIGIKLTSPGPVLFKQERVGLNRRTFQMYKFRTMHVQPKEVSDTAWTTSDDSRRTRFGAFLRRTSLDELPQFINVLKGDMSVVGPRPERPYFVEQFKEEIPRYMIKHHIRPGITGWAQSKGLRGDTSIKDRISHDIFYIENWSFLFDLKIIVRTIFKGFINKNAY